MISKFNGRGVVYILVAGAFISCLVSRCLAGPLYSVLILQPPANNGGAGGIPLSIADNGQIVGYYGSEALLWANNTATPVALTTTNSSNQLHYTSIVSVATNGSQQGGYSFEPVEHALLWSGPGETLSDLNPPNFQSSLIQGMTSSQEVGWGTPTNSSNTNALLWNGSSSIAVNLNPAGFTNSYAYGIYGNLLGGMGASSSTGGNEHAILWNTSNNSYQDLNPNSYESSNINAIYGTQEAGYAYTPGGEAQAMIWSGSAQSAIDLNPQGFAYSRAEATVGAEQVGFASTAGNILHAFVWSGSASISIDLDQFLPAGYNAGIAYGIDGSGDIVGIASQANDPNNSLAVEWIPSTPLPEPSAALLIGILGVASLRRRRSRP